MYNKCTVLYDCMQVRVEDIQGRVHKVSQPFSLDNSKPTFNIFSQWPLNVYFPDLVSKYVIFSLLDFKLVILEWISRFW